MKGEKTARVWSLAGQSADLIRERIESAGLGPVLPGENELSRMLDVSRPTVRAALDLLEKEGVVASTSQGKPRLVAKDWFGKSKAGPSVRFLLAAPLHEASAENQSVIYQMRERLASHGISTAFQVSSAFRAKSPAHSLARDFADAACDVWVVADPTPGIEEWLANTQVPCVCLGGSFHHPLPRIGGDGELAIRRATRSLLDLGHRRIVYPLHNAYGVHMAVAFREVLEGHGVEWNESFHTPRWQDHAVNWYPMLERMFASAQPPTAFLTLGVRNLLPLLTWLGQNGLRTPDDVSIIHRLDDPLLEHLYPPLTFYRLNRDRLCHAAVELVLRLAQDGKPFDEARMIPMQRIEGRSTAPPPSAGMGIGPWNPNPVLFIDK